MGRALARAKRNKNIKNGKAANAIERVRPLGREYAQTTAMMVPTAPPFIVQSQPG